MAGMDRTIEFQGWKSFAGVAAESGNEESAKAAEFGRLLLATVKKYPMAHAEFLRLAEMEEAARAARVGCERCRGKRVVVDDGEA